MNKRSVTLGIACLALLLVGAWFAHRLAFDWHSLRVQLHSVSWTHVATAVTCIYLSLWFRALRWKVLIGPGKQVSSTALIAPQFIGFTAVAIFGRLADLARPYLIARRTGLPVASQIAVYSIERTFDLASAAILFSAALAFAPHDMPHHEAFVRAGVVSMAATLFLAAFALTIRFAGDFLSSLTGRLLRPLFPKFAESAAQRILDFRAGLSIFSSARDFFLAFALSLIVWIGVAIAYVQSAHAMAATPQLANFSFTQTMLLLATSMGGSLLQLPILGWFTQIALLAAAVHTFFDAPIEAATAYGALLLFINTLSIIPVGLIAAKLQGTSLRSVAEQAEAVEEAPPA